MRIRTRSILQAAIAAAIVATLASSRLQAWGPQGHRLVALVAENRLTSVARQNVDSLLSGGKIADIAVWADSYRDGNTQTGLWHFVNIPPDARGYDRDRDCPRQPGVQAGSSADRWRDCVVDRIRYNEGRLGDTSLDRADRAIALKFLVHLVGDLHQPFHALATARGGNDISIVLFGSANCPYPDGAPRPCNLHGVWDSGLIEHRKQTDQQYLVQLTRQIQALNLNMKSGGTAAEWASESLALAKEALLRPGGAADESYYRTQIQVIDQRLALGGVRLAALLNRVLTQRL